MQFETFRGRDVAEALSAVRAAFGPDALIGSTRMVRNERGALGRSFVEVTAAPVSAGGDDPVRSSPFARDAERSRSEPAAAPRRPAPLLGPRARPTSGATPGVDSQVGAELRELRRLIESVATGTKPRDRAFAMVSAAGIEGTLAMQLAAGGARVRGDDKLREWLRKKLAGMIDVATGPLASEGPRLLACIGPTGVGKTTTLAKLAARGHFELGRRVAIVTLDTYRVGAVEQMRRFAELMGVPFFIAHDRAAFARTLADRPAELVLVDTPSRAPGDDAAMRRLRDCLDAGADRFAIDVLLAVPATIRARDVERLSPVFSTCPPTGLVVTKLDETDQVGGIVHAAVRGAVPFVHLCDGPRVPEDLRDASVEAIVDAVLPVDR